MSNKDKSEELQEFIQRLQELSTLRSNDVRTGHYVKYINTFLQHFGDERVYLVGSTGERTKLRWSTDCGDADFVFVSGKLSIPVENIQHREGMEDYIWIKKDDANVDLGDRSYLCPEMLKTVSPDLFTLLRAIYSIATSPIDITYGRVATALKSKVGLALELYANLQISDHSTHNLPSHRTEGNGRSKEFSVYLRQRWKDVEVNPVDKKLLFRILKFVGEAKSPGFEGQFGYYASMIEAAFERRPFEETVETGDDSSVGLECGNMDNADIGSELVNVDNAAELKIKATYTDKSSKDFVPALRVVGKLSCISDFRERVQHRSWPGVKLADEVCSKDVFIVSRQAPISPDERRDFRLSFNLAEGMLVKSFPPVARTVLLILKSYLKGAIRKEFRQNKRNEKLRSYHMKTVMLWMCEEEEIDFWTEANMLTAIHKVLKYLQICLDTKCLKHYIIGSNLIAEFETSDFEHLSGCLANVINDPVSNIKTFFEMDKEVIGEVWLNSEEISYIKSDKEDDGRNKAIDHMEDAVIDVVRGMNDGEKDEHGNAPLKKAILSLCDVFFEDEDKHAADRNTQTNQSDAAKLVAHFMKAFVKDDGDQTYTRTETRHTLDLLVGIGSLFPKGQRFLQTIGGRDGLHNVLTSTNESSDAKRKRLKDAIVRFLDCDDNEVKDAGVRLKQEITAYFITRTDI